MNYAELPVSERIELASDYALLLIEDSIANEDIISDICERFFLSREEAILAFERTRTIHTSDFKKLQNNSILKVLGALFVSIACGLFYAFLGSEVGWIFIVFGSLFLFVAYAGFGVLVEKLLDKFFYTPGKIKRQLDKVLEKPGQERSDWSIQLFVFCFFAALVLLFNYLKKEGCIDVNGLRTESMVVSQPAEQKRTRAKRSTHCYAYHFYGFPNEFILSESYYIYGFSKFRSTVLAPGDAVSVQVKKSEYNKVQSIRYNLEENEGKPIEIVNLLIGDRPLIDMAARNNDKMEKNKRYLLIALGAMVLSVTLMILRQKAVI